jgi:hypothetical protein
MIALLLACATGPWTEEAALAPHRDRLDADHDGRVSAAEYDRHRWNGPPFATADTDADGDLSAAELTTLVRAQSPTTFDAPLPQPAVAQGQVASSLPSAAEQDLWELFVWMADSLRAAGDPAPDPEAVRLAVRSRRVDSAESRALLDTMRPAWLAHGWAWPAGLP